VYIRIRRFSCYMILLSLPYAQEKVVLSLKFELTRSKATANVAGIALHFIPSFQSHQPQPTSASNVTRFLFSVRTTRLPPTMNIPLHKYNIQYLSVPAAASFRYIFNLILPLSRSILSTFTLSCDSVFHIEPPRPSVPAIVVVETDAVIRGVTRPTTPSGLFLLYCHAKDSGGFLILI